MRRKVLPNGEGGEAQQRDMEKSAAAKHIHSVKCGANTRNGAIIPLSSEIG